MGIQDQLHRTSKIVTGKRFLKVASPSRLKFHRSVNSGALYLHPLRILRGELAPQSKFRQRSFFRSLYYRVKAKQPLSLHPAIKGARGLRSRSFNASYLRSQFISLPKRSSAPKSAWDHSVPQRLTDRRGPYVPSLISGWPSPFFVSYLETKHLKEELDADSTLLSFINQFHKSEDSYGSSLQIHFDNSSVIQHVATAWSRSWSFLVESYLTYSHLPRLDLYLRLKMSQKRDSEHFLRFRFKYNRLFVVFENGKDKQTQFFVTPGLFIKYFQSKKSLKKNKAMKFLMMRFLRKILLSLKVPSVGIITRGVPLHISSLITSLFRPLSHPFLNPLTSEVINETVQGRAVHSNISISSILFLAAKPKYFQKTRKRGRIKRKIRRKIVRSANLVD